MEVWTPLNSSNKISLAASPQTRDMTQLSPAHKSKVISLALVEFHKSKTVHYLNQTLSPEPAEPAPSPLQEPERRMIQNPVKRDDILPDPSTLPNKFLQ
ncbi:hypothetical protein Y1Q_0006277 [Alligator mississippiensis]|uniref:Uncharacterized protein n=1 Tax=Alligator mississippiensis TaxID=8496 RepID=A0A151NY02_ALLMI|nr:hypothetical protein Y1Q_0006277 [Alligator mississippiensis]